MPDPYTQLLEWRRGESTTRGLAKLPVDFYATTRAYLQETRHTFESELRSNPSSRKGELARQTYQRAHQLARDVVEARARKVLELAFQAALGGTREVPNALPEDRALFDRFLETVRLHRSAVAPYLDPAPATPGEAPSPPPAVGATPTPAPAVVRAEAVRPVAGLVYVRIVRDGRPIALGSETIEIRKEDVLSVPEPTAQLLVTAGLAERLHGPPARPVVT